MKAVVFYETGSSTMEQIMAVYPRHKVYLDSFVEKDRFTESDPLLVAAMDQWEYLRVGKSQRSLLRMTPSSWKGLLAKLQSKNGMTLYCNSTG